MINEVLAEDVLRSLLIAPEKRKTGDEIICDCPFCGKEKHFYINSKTNLWNCKRCGREGNLKTFLYGIGRSDLLKELPTSFSINGGALSSIIPTLKLNEKNNNFLKESKQIRFPVGFKRVYFDKYLDKRNFIQEDYFFHPVGYTNLKSKYKNYIIIGITEGSKLVGFVSRYVGKGRGKLRYKNSEKTDFANFFFNFNSINNSIETIILTEGIFDAISTENNLQLKNYDEIKVLATFGKKISDQQRIKLKSTKAKNIILLYDGRDAIKELKKYSLILQEDGFNVSVGFEENGDPGSWNKKTFLKVFDSLSSPEEFFYSKLKKI